MNENNNNIVRLREIIAYYNDVVNQKGLYNCDDKIELKAQKTHSQTKRKLPLTPFYKNKMQNKRDSDGNYIIYRWRNKYEDSEYISNDDYNRLPKLAQCGYYPCFEKTVNMQGNCFLTDKGNEFILRYNGLETDFSSRYTKTLDSMLELNKKGIMQYLGMGTTIKHRRESLRHHLKKCFAVSEYEWNLIFSGDIGIKMFNDLKSKAKKEYPTTLYLQGEKKFKGRVKKVKLYNVTAYETGRDDNRPSDKYKLEVTLYRHFFKKHGIGISDIITQPKIIEIPEVKREVEKTFKKVYTMIDHGGQSMIKERVKVKNKNDLFSSVVNGDRTLHKIENRIRDLELQIKNVIVDQQKMDYRLGMVEHDIQMLKNS